MLCETDLYALTLADISRRCAQETELFYRHLSNDPVYCFELFRRAFVDGDEDAWELVYDQYRPLVVGWVKHHSAFLASAEEAQYFVNRTFEKMWAAMNPAKFSRFPDLKSLLRYMQVCVHSVVVDRVRAAGKPTIHFQSEDFEKRVNPTVVEDQALDRVRRQEFWEEINARMRNEKERRVVYGSFVLDLKPREIYARFPETFTDVSDVYRVKENVLARLRRDVKLQKVINEHA